MAGSGLCNSSRLHETSTLQWDGSHPKGTSFLGSKSNFRILGFSVISYVEVLHYVYSYLIWMIPEILCAQSQTTEVANMEWKRHQNWGNCFP